LDCLTDTPQSSAKDIEWFAIAFFFHTAQPIVGTIKDDEGQQIRIIEFYVENGGYAPAGATMCLCGVNGGLPPCVDAARASGEGKGRQTA